MKNIFKYMKAILACLFVSLAFVACSDDDERGSADLGLGIKVFAPTRVVAGQPMTINGSGFDNVTEIEFPGGVKVSSIEHVTPEMMRVVAPVGIAAEGGTILIHDSKGATAESRQSLTVGKTVIIGYSKQAGEKINGLDEITIYGEDLVFVNEIELVDENGEPLIVPQSDFSRIASTRLVLKVPNNILTGTFAGKIKTFDGQNFTMPEFEYEPTATGGGHWEISRRFLWKNEDPAGNGAVSWNGTYRLSNVEHITGEQLYAFPMEDWELIKEGTVYFLYDGGDNANVRVTTGWWSAAYGGGEFNCSQLATVDEETGMKVIELNIKEDGNIYGSIDDQHLLFTGSDYTPMGVFVLDQTWVEGEGGHLEMVRKTFWKNGQHSTIPAPAWSGEGRFCRASNVTGEQTWAFTDEEWEILKSEPFRIQIEKLADWVNLRVTTGWWSTNYLGMESLNDLIQQEEDGSYYVEINLKDDPALLALIDDQHLLFTGQDYKLLEIYQVKEEWVGGDAGDSEVVLWEGKAVADDWGNQPFILSDAGLELAEAGAKAGQILYFYITPTEANWNLQIVEGHWGDTYVDYNQDNWDLEAHGGAVELELTPAILDKALIQQWWGGAFLLNGDNVVCTKVTLK